MLLIKAKSEELIMELYIITVLTVSIIVKVSSLFVKNNIKQKKFNIKKLLKN